MFAPIRPSPIIPSCIMCSLFWTEVHKSSFLRARLSRYDERFPAGVEGSRPAASSLWGTPSGTALGASSLVPEEIAPVFDFESPVPVKRRRRFNPAGDPGNTGSERPAGRGEG